MLKTNRERLPIISVQGQVSHPTFGDRPIIDTEGRVHYLVRVGGITYNAKLGDPCCGWVGDHVEPGVSSKHPDEKMNKAYHLLTCVGNEAKVISGDAKGSKGFVIGKHGGIDDVMIHFDDAALEKMAPEDKILVKAQGQGLALLDYPDIVLRSTSPALLDKMNIVEEDGVLKVGVAKCAPAKVMGSGLGSMPSAEGDYDITLFDQAVTKEYGLDELRFGDIVAILDADTRFGRTYQGGAVTIGVVVHSDCLAPGHGPGVTTLMSALGGKIVPVVDPKANLKDFFL